MSWMRSYCSCMMRSRSEISSSLRAASDGSFPNRSMDFEISARVDVRSVKRRVSISRVESSNVFKRAVGTGVLPVIVINLIIGFTIPAIDNSAHIGGLLAGAALAAVIPFQKPGNETDGGFRSIQIALLALIAVSFYEVGAHDDGPRLSVRNLTRGLIQIGTTSSTEDFIEAINAAQKTFDY